MRKKDALQGRSVTVFWAPTLVSDGLDDLATMQQEFVEGLYGKPPSQEVWGQAYVTLKQQVRGKRLHATLSSQASNLVDCLFSLPQLKPHL